MNTQHHVTNTELDTCDQEHEKACGEAASRLLLATLLAIKSLGFMMAGEPLVKKGKTTTTSLTLIKL